MIKTRLQRFWKNYLAMWQELNGWRLFLFYALHYTVLFAVMWQLLFPVFAEVGNHFIWKPDGVGLWSTNLVYISKTFREAIQSLLNGNGWTFPLYDFTKGMIERDLRLEPIQLLAVLWPCDKIDVLYDILVIVRFYLAGLSFSVFGFYFKQKSLPIMIGTISYVFCLYALYAGIRHPFFMQAMIYLPILMIGIEKVMKKEKPFLLIGIVFLILISNVYWACIQGVIGVIYVLVRFPALYEKNRPREFGCMMSRLILTVGVAALLSGVLFVAPLLQNLRAGRVGNSVVLQYRGVFQYVKGYYSKFISRFIVSGDGVGGGSWVFLGFSVLAVPAIALLFVNGKKEHRTLRAMFIVLTAMLMFPIVAYVMSGFNAVTNRWCLAYGFCVSAIIMFELPVLVEANKKTLVYAGLVVLAYCFVCRFVIKQAYYQDYVLMFLLLTVIAIVMCCSLNGQKRNIILSVCLIITCLSVNFTAHRLYDKDGNNYVSEFYPKGSLYANIKQSPYGSFSKGKAIKTDDSFYRVAQNQYSEYFCNAPFYYGINGTDGWSQWYYESYDNWIKEMEIPQVFVFGTYFGVGSRAALQSLDSIKYYVMRNSVKSAPIYGFQEIEQIENGKNTDLILENQYALPLGYTYDRYLDRNTFEALGTMEKQEAQIQAAVLENSPESSDIVRGNPEFTAKQISVNVADSANVEWKNGILKVSKDGGTMTLVFAGLPKTETYLRVVNLDITNGVIDYNLVLRVSCGGTNMSGNFYSGASLYGNGLNTQMINLGYTEEGYTTCTLTFPKKGTYVLDDLQIWCQPMDNFAGQIEALRAEPLENIETNWRGLSGMVSLSKDKILCVSVPYSEGWTAYVDGKKAEILQVNTAFMGLELSAGEHTIEFKYWTPGLTAGIILSILGVAALAWLILRWRKGPLWTPDEVTERRRRGRK